MHHILLVDKDSLTQRTMTILLADAGYAVTSAFGRVEAVRLLSEHSNRFDILLTEVDSPDEITGISLASFSRRIRPGRPTVFTSEHPESLMGWLHNNEAFVQKPLSSQALLKAMITVLS